MLYKYLVYAITWFNILCTRGTCVIRFTTMYLVTHAEQRLKFIYLI